MARLATGLEEWKRKCLEKGREVTYCEGRPLSRATEGSVESIVLLDLRMKCERGEQGFIEARVAASQPPYLLL